MSMRRHSAHSWAEEPQAGRKYPSPSDIAAIYAEVDRSRGRPNFELHRAGWHDWWLAAARGAASDGDATSALVALTQAGAAIAAGADTRSDEKWTSVSETLISAVPPPQREAKAHEVRALFAELRALRCRACGHLARARSLEQLRHLHEFEARRANGGQQWPAYEQ